MRWAPLPRRLRRSVLTLGTAVGAVVALGLVLQHVESSGSFSPPMSQKPRPADAGAVGATKAQDPFAAAFQEGITGLRSGDAHAALKAFETARSVRPHVAAVHANLGFTLLELSRPGLAREQFEIALSIRPGLANAYFGLAAAEEGLGNVTAAKWAMRSYLHLSAKEDERFRRKAAAALWEWAGAGAAVPRAEEDVREDRSAMAGVLGLEVSTLDGMPGALAPYRGRITVLNVWATWCAPCRAELPALDSLAARVDPRQIAIVGLNVDKEPAFVREYLADLGIGFANFSDPRAEALSSVLAVDGYPLTLVLGRDGEVLAQVLGARDWSSPRLAATLAEFAEDATLIADLMDALR